MRQTYTRDIDSQKRVFGKGMPWLSMINRMHTFYYLQAIFSVYSTSIIYKSMPFYSAAAVKLGSVGEEHPMLLIMDTKCFTRFNFCVMRVWRNRVLLYGIAQFQSKAKHAFVSYCSMLKLLFLVKFFV